VNAAYLFAALGPDDTGPSSSHHVRVAAEEALAGRLREGDPDALEQLYRAYHAAMWDVAYRYVRDNDMAEDVVHDVFRACWEGRASLTLTGTFPTYLFGAVRHRALNVLRHAGIIRRAAMTFDNDDVPALGNVPPAADAQLLEADLDAHVRRYLEALPERTRTLVLLRWKHGLTYGEIAAALGMSGDAAKKLGQRVQQILRPLLENVKGL